MVKIEQMDKYLAEAFSIFLHQKKHGFVRDDIKVYHDELLNEKLIEKLKPYDNIELLAKLKFNYPHYST